MTTPEACRICLITDVRLFKYGRYGSELIKYYEQIINSKINEREGLPSHFCYECAAMLHKFHKFREKCLTGLKVLKDLMWKGPISVNSIKKIDRQSMNLQSSLDIISVNRRVRTCTIKAKQVQKVRKLNSPIEIDLESVSSDSDDYSVDNFEERGEIPPSPELVEVDKKNVVDIEVICEEKIKPDNENHNIVLVDELMPVDNLVATEEVCRESEKESIPDDKVCDKGNNQSDEDEEFLKKPESQSVAVKKKKNAKITRKKKKLKDDKTVKKSKKFEVNSSSRKANLDPKNWLKLNLTEEEAVEEFKARALNKRYISAEYKCNDCFRGFSKEDMLNRHFKLRHSESVGPIECRFCRMRFTWKCYLRKHMKQHYTKYKCLRCDLVCPLETTAIFHEEYHNGVIRKCAHCDQEFKHLTTYYTHLRTHRSKHVCTLCGASFVSEIGLGIHKKIKHINAESTVTEGADSGGEYCKRCDIKFETRNAYEEHLIQSAMHGDGMDEDPDVEEAVRSNLRKRRQNQNRRLTRIPTDCHICGKHFATQAACRKHHLAEHPRLSFFPPNERHICEICGISLAPGSVSSHLNTHTREKSYSCSTCGRQFSSKGGVTMHQLTHTSEKPAACTLCDKRFKQVSSMRLHYRTFHLKEPYPKRNRRKKTEEVSKFNEFTQADSDENMTLDRWR